MPSISYRFQKDYYRILSFDGGGVRGILSAILICRLAKECPEIVENTDLFVGTSAGAFIALSLATGISPAEIVDLFSHDNAKKIFGNPRPYYFFKPKHSNKPLKKILQGIFPSELRLRDLQKNVVIPSFKLYSEETKQWTPIFFNNFPSSINAAESVINVALASSAAPIYFPAYHKYIDGGVIANNPDLTAISYAVGKEGAQKKLENIVHLSFGTGWNPWKIKRDTSNWGLIQWMYSLIPGPSNPKLPLLSILTDGDVDADMYVCAQLLHERYLRLNPKLGEKIVLDDYNKIPYLIELANEIDLGPALSFLKAYWRFDENFRLVNNQKT